MLMSFVGCVCPLISNSLHSIKSATRNGRATRTCHAGFKASKKQKLLLHTQLLFFMLFCSCSCFVFVFCCCFCCLFVNVVCIIMSVVCSI